MSNGAGRNQWKVLLICPSRQMSQGFTERLAEAAPYAPVTELRDYAAGAQLVQAVQSSGANLVAVDACSQRERALELCAELAALDSRLPIVALHATHDSDHVLRCLRQGATEFLLAPFTLEDLQGTLNRLGTLYRTSGQEESQAKVYCVMPVKGACGASTLACCLAYQLKRLGAKRVLLADLDPLTGTLSFQLKLKSGYSFADALSRGSGLDTDVWKGLVYSAQGVDVLLSPEKPLHGLDELHDLGGLVDFARFNYDAVVTDTNGVYGQWCLTLARQCDELLLVTTNELPSLQAAQRSLAYLDQNRIDRGKVRVVVNRYHKDVGMTRDVIEAALQTEIFHLLPSDYETVQRALVEGRPVPNNTPLGKSLVNLAEKLNGKEVDEEPAAKPGGLAGLFGFLGGR